MANKCSLEECPTNVFVLGDLHGLRWKRFKALASTNGDIADDAILTAYGKCAQAGMICCWRRIPPSARDEGPQQVPNKSYELPSMSTPKELCVFWYGNEPSALSEYTKALYMHVDCSRSWEKEAINYETRCMLFHAWHNSLQRIFEQDGYVRQGRWFVKPLQNSTVAYGEHNCPRYLIAFRFSFFMHDVCVCVSVQTQKQPVLHTLYKQHMQYAASAQSKPQATAEQQRQTVVLAPWSITATLVGPAPERHARLTGGPWANERPSLDKIWTQWCNYTPSLAQRAHSSDGVPQLVEVEVSGVRMYYPSALVTVQRSEDRILQQMRADNSNAQGNASAAKIPSASQIGDYMERHHLERNVCGLLHVQRSMESLLNRQSTSTAFTGDAAKWSLVECNDKDQCQASCSTQPGSSRQRVFRAISLQRRTERVERQQRRNDVAPATPASVQPRTTPAQAPVPTNPASIGPPSANTPLAPLTPQQSQPPTLQQQPNVQMISPVSATVKEEQIPSESAKVEPQPLSYKRPQSLEVNDTKKCTKTCEEAPALKVPRLELLDRRCLYRSKYAHQFGDNSLEEEPKWLSVTTPKSEQPVDSNVSSTLSFDAADTSAAVLQFFNTEQPISNMVCDTIDENNTFISPPASNEQQQHFDCPAQAALTRRIITTGPPSVDYIYPTPPSVAEYHHLSPEGTHNQIVPGLKQEDVKPPAIETQAEPPVYEKHNGEIRSRFHAKPFALRSSSIKARMCTYTVSKKTRTMPRLTRILPVTSAVIPSTTAQTNNSQPYEIPASVKFSAQAMLSGTRQPRRPRMSPYNARAAPETPSPAPGFIASPLSHRGPHSLDMQSMTPAGAQLEADALVFVVLLADSTLDLFHDVQFDSCPLCVCGNKGNESGVYVPAPNIGTYGTASQCSCAFSAVRYRYVSQMSGAFAEDEYDATNDPTVWDSLRRKPLEFDRTFVELLRQQSAQRDLPSQVVSSIFPERQATEAFMQRDTCKWPPHPADFRIMRLDIHDVNHLANTALTTACRVLDQAVEAQNKPPPQVEVSPWGYQRAGRELRHASDNESMCILKIVQQTLEARIAQQMNIKVQGPLTWRAFDKLLDANHASRSNVGKAEPIPHVLVQNERELIAISPLSLRLWDRLLLEPYSPPKDVIYVALLPDVRHIVDRSRQFFRELSKTYENFRYGRHVPLAPSRQPPTFTDGFLKIGDRFESVVMDDRRFPPIDPWFEDTLVEEVKRTNVMSESQQRQLVQMLRLYARACRHALPKLLGQENAFDRAAFRHSLAQATATSVDDGVNAEMPPPSAPSLSSTGSILGGDEDDGALAHVVTVYIVDAFNCGANNKAAVRLTPAIIQAMHRCYIHLINELPSANRPSLQIEIVPLQTVLDCTGGLVDFGRETRHNVISIQLDPGATIEPHTRQTAAQALREIATNVYTQTRSVTVDQILSPAKSLTAMGPAAAQLELLLKNNELPKHYRMAQVPYALAPPIVSDRFRVNKKGNSNTELVKVNVHEGNDDEHMLLVSYCLSENQRWLLATATNGCGTMFESCMINLNEFTLRNTDQWKAPLPGVYERLLARQNFAINKALNALWRFVLGILSSGCHPWRLVIGRVGRLGHGELRTWSQILHRSQLTKFDKWIREKCYVCRAMPPGHSAHRTYQDTPCIMSVALVATDAEPHLRVFNAPKQHASTTHLLVAPMSATINDPSIQHDEGPADEIGLELGSDITFDELDLGTDGFDGVMGGLDMFAALVEPSTRTKSVDDINPIDAQPLAIGYTISTAPAAGLPAWLWTQVEAGRRHSPVHLRSSLHLRVGSNDLTEDAPETQLLRQQGNSQHPLDATRTDNVLRFILEKYNALSWLNMDGSGERRSCLPVHIQALMNMYRSTWLLLPR